MQPSSLHAFIDNHPALVVVVVAFTMCGSTVAFLIYSIGTIIREWKK